MSDLSIKQLGETVGAEIVDVDVDELLHDPSIPEAVLHALDAYGVLVFRELGLDDGTQVAFARRLGTPVAVASHPIPEITVISLADSNPIAEYLKGAFEYHIDGSMDEIPSKASLLTAYVVPEESGDTEFASSYAAYDALSDEEKVLYEGYQVVHSFEASQLKTNPNPTPEELADWRTRPTKLHPLVWKHEHGRKSLVLGATASHIEGMDVDEGRALLARLLDMATAPGRVYRHKWTVGDLVIWDNRGVMHRACEYSAASNREMHRTTLVGEEAIN
jgi:alpha-ketoglutarate-dependent taurine dioxygenase